MSNIFTKLLSFITNPIAEVVGGWQARKTAAQQGAIDRSTAAMAGLSDEYLLGIWSAPFIMMFTPWHEIAVRGFERLSLLPDWYVGGFVSISFSVFGITQLFKWKGK